MFFFIGGITSRTVVLDDPLRICPSCGRLSRRLQRVDRYLSLFFVPVVRVQKGEPSWSCVECGAGCGEIFPRRSDGAPFSGSSSVCRTCGRRLDPDFRFCPKCGMRTD